MTVYRGEHAPSHPPFPAHSAAACGPADGPVPPSADAIVYSDADEQVLETWLRAHVGTTWHSLGTCAMRRREAGGVVDGRLRVYGVEGLRVADLSVVPGNVAANTASTAMMIGEKAAVLVGEDLGVAVE
jgi:alcohol oxidase